VRAGIAGVENAGGFMAEHLRLGPCEWSRIHPSAIARIRLPIVASSATCG
jgi:hypothetical protein